MNTGLSGKAYGQEMTMVDSDYNEAMDCFYQRLCNEFGLASGKAILRIFFEEMGGVRLSVPTIVRLEKEARDQRICNEFNGINHEELAIRFGLSVRQVRRIVNEQ